MTRYIAKVLIVVEADDDDEAYDAVSAGLSDNLKYSGAIVEWSYTLSQATQRWRRPRRLPPSAPDDLQDADLDALWMDAQPKP